jgi:3',5'-nucleoside bisphosphate phosphatase
MKKNFLIITLLFIFTMISWGQKKIVHLPDLPGYITLKCDFHMHTVFSDGNVWPTVRIGEAVRDGLDAIAITDHIEYTPNKNYVTRDLNGAWKVTESMAKDRNIILVHGAEITRGMPPGHINALFIKDASALEKDSVWDVFTEAINQGAFLQWNHPGWKSQQPDGIPRMYDIHKKLISKGWLHGIEFFNETEYYPLVLTWCRQYNIAVMGNSDVHGNISEVYSDPVNTNRPMTLVFAKERSHDSLKEALFAGRTLVYFRDILAGKEEYAKPFFYNCISIGKPFSENERVIYFEITNNSDIPFYLINGPANAPSSITLQANGITRVTLNKKVTLPLIYDVKNIITGENEILKVEIKY